MSKRNWVLALMAVTTIPASYASQQLEIRIRLEGSRHFSARTLRGATDCVGQLFATVGLRTTWNKGGPAEIRLEIVDRRPVGMEESAMGYTGTAPLSAGVVASLVKAVAERMGLPEAVVLGTVVAHEAGHLLGLQHAEGIMATEFKLKDYLMASRGSLRFTASDGQRLREAVANMKR